MKLTLLATAVIAGTIAGGNVAAAEEPAGKLYTCDALTSASVSTVKKQLKSMGIDPKTVTGPVGLSCRTGAEPAEDGVRAGLTGVDTLAYTCASAEEKSRKVLVFFVDCAD
jgi:NADPH-dependent 2,4-dienoyl-CoA reductase/sulfur reductase-like enzyme